MNILIITSEFGNCSGGLSLSSSRLYNILAQRHSVTVSISNDLPVNTIGGGYNSVVANGLRYEYKLKEDVCKYRNVDLVLGFSGGFNGYYAAVLSGLVKARFILCLRGSDINLAKWNASESWYIKESCQRASRIVCLSKEMINNVCELVPAVKSKTTIIPNQLEEEYKAVKFPNLPHSLLIGCGASHLNEKKGVANLIYMVSEFKEISSLPIVLELVGEIDEEIKAEYERIIRDLNLNQNITFVGRESRYEFERRIEKWDFYIQGSICEGHSNSIMECVKNGCAFISTNTGYVAETLSVEYPELFFDTWNPTDMAVKLLHLVEREDKLTLYNEAYKTLSVFCGKDNVEKSWHNLIEENEKWSSQIEVDNILAVGLHDVDGTEHDSITTPIAVFEDFAKFVDDNGWKLCSMQDYVEKSATERKLCIVCTFDDGYKSLVKNALPILSKYNFTASVFVCTNLIGKDNSWNNKDGKTRFHLDMSDIISLSKAGWEIASHGQTHRNLLKLNDIEVDEELSLSKRLLEDIVGETISYSYPYGAFNKYIQQCVGKYYEYAFAVSQGGTSLAVDKMQIKRYSISEIYEMIKK